MSAKYEDSGFNLPMTSRNSLLSANERQRIVVYPVALKNLCDVLEQNFKQM